MRTSFGWEERAGFVGVKTCMHVCAAIVHTGAKPHQCWLCPDVFSQAAYLKKHLKIVHAVDSMPAKHNAPPHDKQPTNGTIIVII